MRAAKPRSLYSRPTKDYVNSDVLHYDKIVSSVSYLSDFPWQGLHRLDLERGGDIGSLTLDQAIHWTAHRHLLQHIYRANASLKPKLSRALSVPRRAAVSISIGWQIQLRFFRAPPKVPVTATECGAQCPEDLRYGSGFEISDVGSNNSQQVKKNSGYVHIPYIFCHEPSC